MLSDMMINRRRVYGGKKLPYDAEIEYLENNITDTINYIDTGVAYSDDIYFEVKAALIDVFSYNGTTYFITFGGFQGSYSAGYEYTWKAFLIQTGKWGSYVVKKTADKDWHIYKTDANTGSIDNHSDRRGFFPGTITAKILNRGTKIAYCILRKGNNIVLDLIPVRVGTTGYLYDKVSGQLFGNQGTGSFILGPDK